MIKYLVKCTGGKVLNVMFDTEQAAIGWLTCNKVPGGARRRKSFIREHLINEGWCIHQVELKQIQLGRPILPDEEIPYGKGA